MYCFFYLYFPFFCTSLLLFNHQFKITLGLLMISCLYSLWSHIGYEIKVKHKVTEFYYSLLLGDVNVLPSDSLSFSVLAFIRQVISLHFQKLSNMNAKPKCIENLFWSLLSTSRILCVVQMLREREREHNAERFLSQGSAVDPHAFSISFHYSFHQEFYAFILHIFDNFSMHLWLFPFFIPFIFSEPFLSFCMKCKKKSKVVQRK